MVGKKLKRPSPVARRRIAAGKHHQLGIDVTCYPRRPAGARLVFEAVLQTVRQKTHTRPLNVAGAGAKQGNNPFIRKTVLTVLVRQQQYSGLGLCTGRRDAGVEQIGKGFSI